MASNATRNLALLCALACGVAPLAAMAQSMPYGNVTGGMGGGGGSSRDSGDGEADADNGSRGGHGGKRQKRTIITPYIEALQVVDAQLEPTNEVLTYSGVAVGVDGMVVGNRSSASFSVRYERRYGWGKAEDHDFVSGVARGNLAVAPGVQIEAGGLATRARVNDNGVTSLAGLGDHDTVTQVYSVYGGPTVQTQVGDVAVNGGYRLGYTRMDRPNSHLVTPTGPVTDVFDESVTHNAELHAGIKPDTVLPIGIGVGGGYYREDQTNLDQRIEDKHARADVTIPVSGSVALVGGVGYEQVEISHRDARRDAAGNPLSDNHGHYVKDTSAPRVLAYDTDGLIWDAGVIWRPSRRTALEAHVGRRYGATTFYGSFAHAPNARSSFNVSVYDNVAGVGGQINRALFTLPTEFTVMRNPVSGSFNGCVASLEGNGCIDSAIGGAARSAAFRARGVMASYNYDFGAIQTGLGAGYDRRKFVAAPGTVLAWANGLIDENYWMSAYLGARIDAKSYFSTNVYAGMFNDGALTGSDMTNLSATALYRRSLTRHLSASAAVQVDGIMQDAPLPDIWDASAMLGVRYSF